MPIRLEGLTAQQRDLAQLIWQCDDTPDIDRLISALPKQLKQDAELVRELMIAAVFDQHEDISDEVRTLITAVSRS
jgi:hypothetical protein